MTPEALKLRADNNLAQLPPKERDRVSWILSAGADDMQRQLKSMTGTAADRRVLEVAYDLETAGAKRSTRLKPVAAALKRFRPPADEPTAPESLAKSKPIDGKAEVTTDHPDDLENEDPRWKTLRETLQTARDIGRSLVECKAWIGWQLACLKKDHGVARGKIGNGRPAESRSADSADLLTWPEILKAKTGLERRTADEMIRIFEATQAKLKRLKAPESKAALAIFRSGNPLSVPPEQREHLRDIVASVCTGQTVGSMLEELGVVPRPVAPKQTAEKTKGEEPTAGQLAFHFFEPLAAELLRHRSSADFDKLVIALPLHPDEQNPVALSTIEADLRAILEKVESAKAAHAKPAKGKAAP